MKDQIVTIFGFLALAVVVISPVACTMNRQAVIAEAIRGGADPIAAKCAIEADMGMSAMCIAKAMQP